MSQRHLPMQLTESAGRIPVSVMIFTLNEEIHLQACLDSLGWCADIIVVDSYSTDRTREICVENGVRLFENKFLGFGTQRNWALDNTEPKYEWILILDADERVTGELRDELRTIAQDTSDRIVAYRVKRRFHMWGRWLQYSSLYPTYVVRLIRKGRVRYANRGHAETQVVEGEIASLRHDLVDENLKGIDEWFERQNRYSTKDAEYELAQELTPARWAALFSRDPLTRREALKRGAARLPARTVLYFLYSYIGRLGVLDGRDGFVFCLMRAVYQAMVVIKKHDLKRSGRRVWR